MEQNGQANGRRVRAEETDITRFKNEISRRAIVMTLVFAVFGILVIAVLFALGHVSFKPVAVKYLYGLLVGLCVAQMNFVILARTLEAMLASGKRGLLPLSYMLRLLIYGGFFLCMRKAVVCRGACVRTGLYEYKSGYVLFLWSETEIFGGQKNARMGG